VDIDPALADFNIHPAKREARFRDPGALHHAITSGLRDFCRHVNLNTEAQPERASQCDPQCAPQRGMTLAMEALFDNSPAPVIDHGGNVSNLENNIYDNKINNIDYLRTVISPSAAAEPAPKYSELRYVGRAFGFFILAEYGDRLFVIDQHAAHERLLYHHFLSGPIPRQELLIPIVSTAETSQDAHPLATKKEELAKLAIVIEQDGDGWRIDALPQGWHMGDAETVREILALRTAHENIAERWAATLCCHQAVRDGDYLDDATALALAEEALALPIPRCPHGRPIWTEITRDALCRAVRRS
jgi:DNA mismatch repair protein MutL